MTHLFEWRIKQFRILKKPVVEEVLLAAYKSQPFQISMFLERFLPPGAGTEIPEGIFYLAEDVFSEVCRIVHEEEDRKNFGMPPGEAAQRIERLFYAREKEKD